MRARASVAAPIRGPPLLLPPLPLPLLLLCWFRAAAMAPAEVGAFCTTLVDEEETTVRCRGLTERTGREAAVPALEGAEGATLFALAARYVLAAAPLLLLGIVVLLLVWL